MNFQGTSDQRYQADGLIWMSWKDYLYRQDTQALKQDVAGQNLNDVIIQTTETLKYDYLLKVFTSAMLPMLFIGSTGTGKTIASKQFIKGLNIDKFDSSTLCFSAKSSAFSTQKIIDSKLERRRKGVIGPKLNKTYIFFIDDLNMPAVEPEGAQPAIELLRQVVDHQAWYDFNDKKDLP